MAAPTPHGSIVIAWCGMRGIVTLAAAYALPEGFPLSRPDPACAFTVVVGTLMIQGLTLGPLLAALRLDDDDPVASEVRDRARYRLSGGARGARW